MEKQLKRELRSKGYPLLKKPNPGQVLLLELERWMALYPAGNGKI